MNRRRASTPARPKLGDKPQRKARSEELAREAIAHEQPALGDKVRMTLHVALDRRAAEALAARAIREEKNIGMLVAEILERAAQPPST